MRRILVAVDLSESADVVAGRGLELAGLTGADLIAVHVYHPGVLLQALAESGMAVDKYVDTLEHSLRGLFRDAAAGGARVRTEIVEGPAVGRAILDAASRLGADLIVMGTHGRTGVWRTILGSVAEDVLRQASLPVLVVPARIAAAPSAVHGHPVADGTERHHGAR